MPTAEFDLDDALAILERTPDTLSALLAGLPMRWLQATEEDGSWSPFEVIGHLINGERTNWMPRARHILAGHQRSFDLFDRMPQAAEHQSESVGDLLTTFADLRSKNVAELVGLNLTRADLDRTGLHPDFGEVTLGQLLATWVVHDLNHLGQIVQTMAKVYADAVGPWHAYLAILHEQE